MNNLELMRKRLDFQGGNQESRMIKDKYNTFLKVLKYSYQGADIQKLDSIKSCRALINPDKTKTDYDDKILSVDYKEGFKCGDVFKWLGTDTYWLIYLTNLTEDAYFRAEIRRCKYKLNWIDKESNTLCTSWCYTRGPVETKISNYQKKGAVIDMPNWSLEIFLPNSELSKKYFKRYEKIIFDNMAWEIQVVDSISIDGILQIVAVEDRADDDTDNLEKNIAHYYRIEPVEPENTDDIDGPTFIKPQFSEIYKCDNNSGYWSILEPKRPVHLEPIEEGVKLTWTGMSSGQFTLCYKDNEKEFQKTIVVESLF